MARQRNVMAGLFVWALAGALSTAALAATDGWLTDFEQAKKAATEKKVPIFIDFSGSDWCIWCKRLDAEVLTQKVFKEYAKENLILFLADFPMRKKQTKEVKDQNRELKAKYAVRGYPTVLLVDGTGKELARTGYMKGGAETYVTHLKSLLAKEE